MLSMRGFFSKKALSLTTKCSLYSINKTFVQSTLLSSHIGGYFIRDLVNDLKRDINGVPTESLLEYQKRSIEEFNKYLIGNTYYTYLHKTRISNHESTPEKIRISEAGHIAGFMTDKNGDVINESVMSLRPGKKLRDNSGEYIMYKTELYKTTFYPYLYKTEFLELDVELKDHFFKYNTVGQNIRYLIGIPQKEEDAKEIVEAVAAAKAKLKDEAYLLLDVVIDDIPRKSNNCINGFYKGNNYVGIMSNPHPEVAAWSFLKFAAGAEIRDKLLSNTNIKNECLIVEDDELELIQPHKNLGR